MRNKASIGDYLYFLSVKYEVDLDRIFKGLLLAQKKQEVSCGKLLIQCRKKAMNHVIFLITTGYQVVAQFSVPKDFLDQQNQVEKLRHLQLFRTVSREDTCKGPLHVRDLRCGMKQINLKARVINVPKAVQVFTRLGDYAFVSNALIADETGAIKLCLWNEKIKEVSVDSTIQIENAIVSKFRGENQLKLGKNGRISLIETSRLPSQERMQTTMSTTQVIPLSK